MKKIKKFNTAQTLKKFQHTYLKASVKHDLLMNSYLQKNKDNDSHLDSLYLAAHCHQFGIHIPQPTMEPGIIFALKFFYFELDKYSCSCK